MTLVVRAGMACFHVRQISVPSSAGGLMVSEAPLHPTSRVEPRLATVARLLRGALPAT
jgi:hypothetical protein